MGNGGFGADHNFQSEKRNWTKSPVQIWYICPHSIADFDGGLIFQSLFNSTKKKGNEIFCAIHLMSGQSRQKTDVPPSKGAIQFRGFLQINLCSSFRKEQPRPFDQYLLDMFINWSRIDFKFYTLYIKKNLIWAGIYCVSVLPQYYIYSLLCPVYIFSLLPPPSPPPQPWEGIFVFLS